MPVINDIKDMQMQGMSDEQITQSLAERGLSPLDINQALEQARIKAAVSENPGMEVPMPSRITEEIPEEQMTPSITEQTPMPEYPQYPPEQQPKYTPSPQPPEAPEYIYPTSQPPEYAQYQQYAPSGADTISEIAEQIVGEKMESARKEVNEIKQFKTDADSRIKNIDDRLRRIESIIDKLQSLILGKLGTYGQNIDSINQEMQMMQNSFSKALNPLMNKARDAESFQQKQPSQQMQKKQMPSPKENSKDGFEYYLRR